MGLYNPLAAFFSPMAVLGLSTPKAGFDIESVISSGTDQPVYENIVLSKPFGNLIHFEKNTRLKQPTVLIIAPMSGSYSSLMREMVKDLLPDSDVYATDWGNARDVPIELGEFDLNHYTRYVMEFIQHIGPDVHVIGISQSTIPAIAAASLMAQKDMTHQPASLTLIAGPVDTRISPTALNDFAKTRDLDWFAKNMIEKVPDHYQGKGRLVCSGRKLLPGILTSSSDLLRENFAQSAEHFALTSPVMDLTLEFYIQTVHSVFHEHFLPRRMMCLDGELIDPSHVHDMHLLTIEGENDSVCGHGQTHAAINLFSKIPETKKLSCTIPHATHYEMFMGRRWRQNICPILTNFFRQVGADKGLNYSPNLANSGQLPHNFTCR